MCVYVYMYLHIYHGNFSVEAHLLRLGLLLTLFVIQCFKLLQCIAVCCSVLQSIRRVGSVEFFGVCKGLFLFGRVRLLSVQTPLLSVQTPLLHLAGTSGWFECTSGCFE